jgi:hypothetical protein
MAVPPVASPVPPRLDGPAGSRPRVPWPVWLGLAVVAGALAVVWAAEPQGQFFYPRCWIHQNTGLLCPGCGTTRALHALLHGDLRTAWTLNPLVVAQLPIVLVLGVRAVRSGRAGRGWMPPLRARHIAMLTAVMIVFGVVRNLPGWR